MNLLQTQIEEGKNELRRVRGLILEWDLVDQKAFNDAKSSIDATLNTLSAISNDMVIELVGFIAVERAVKMMEEK